MDSFIVTTPASKNNIHSDKNPAEKKRYSLPQPSNEQKQILNDLKSGSNNIVVNSVFGSGKTTTILNIAKQYSQDNTCNQYKTDASESILILTYNARLKTECRERAHDLGFTHCDIHSYHAFAVKYYAPSCRTDTELQSIIHQQAKPRTPFQFSLIIMDEQQDMSPLYYSWVLKILKDNSYTNPRIVVFGDVYQNIYGYRGGDARFLTWSPSIFTDYSNYSWIRRNISTSFRVSQPIAHFINTHLLHYNRIETSHFHTGRSPVRYLITDAFSRTPFEETLYYLKRGYKPDDIYILAPSLRVSKHLSPIRRLENRLVNYGIPCFVPVSDDEVIADEVSKGKIVFSSFHQIKGSERSVVIVFNFDASYFDFYAKHEPRDQCPNAIYVAVSRAKYRMSLIHHYENDMFPTICEDMLRKDRNIEWEQDRSWNQYSSNKRQKRQKRLDLSVSKLLRHLDENVVEQALSYFEIKSRQSPSTKLNFHSTTKNKDSSITENVSEITGVAIPALFEIKQKGGRCSIINHVRKHLESLPLEHGDRVLKLIHEVYQTHTLTIEEVLYLSNVFLTISSGYICKREQIQTYDWITEKMADKAMSRLHSILNTLYPDQNILEALLFEQDVERIIGDKNIVGRIDILSPQSIIEIKCTETIEKTHLLQAILYAWLTRTTLRDIFVFNIKTNQCLELLPTHGKSKETALDECVHYLLKEKYKPHHILNDTEFNQQIVSCRESLKQPKTTPSKDDQVKHSTHSPKKNTCDASIFQIQKTPMFLSDSDDD